MENLKSHDYDGLLLPVNRLTGDDNPFAKIRELNLYPEFKVPLLSSPKEWKKKISVVKVLQFVAIVYDKNSPLQAIDDIMKRRIRAAKICRFPLLNDKHFVIEYEDVILWHNHVVNKMAMRYCRLQKRPEYTKITKYYEQIHNELVELPQEEDPVKRKAIIQNIDALSKGIDNGRLSILSGDISAEMYEELMESIENELLDLRPEDIALKLSEGKIPVNIEPYKE